MLHSVICSWNSCCILVSSDDQIWIFRSHQVLQCKELPSNRLVSCGSEFFVSIDENLMVYGIGVNRFGQLTAGDAEYIPFESPRQLFGLSEITQVACGENHLLALDVSGTVWGCGVNTKGQLGKNNAVIYTPVILSRNMISIYAGKSASFMTNSESTLYALGCGTSKPVKILHQVQQVVSRNVNTLILDHNAEVWGTNLSNQRGESGAISKPKKIRQLSNVKSMEIVASFSIFLLQSGEIQILGTFQGKTYNEPLNIPHQLSIIQLVALEDNCLLYCSNGVLHCIGNNPQIIKKFLKKPKSNLQTPAQLDLPFILPALQQSTKSARK